MEEKKEDDVRKVVIIGSGPAAYTAGIYTGRALLNPLIITGQKFGGLLVTTTEVENFPGFPDGVNGVDLISRMHDQCLNFGCDFEIDDVVDIDCKMKPFVIKTCSGKIYRSHTVIISTGSSPMWLNAENEGDLRGYGVSTCATCDGSFFKNEEIVVVGGGDSCMEEALYLTRFAKMVTVVHRRHEFKATKIMVERARNHEKIRFKTPFVVEKWLTDYTGKLCGAEMRNTETSDMEMMSCSGAFIAIGHKTNTSFLKGQIETDVNGYLIKKGNSNATSVEGIFVAGDVADPVYKQAITAAGDGCKAAIDTERYLEKNNL